MDLGAALESRRYSKAMAMDFPDPRAEFPAISEADLKAFEGEMEGKGCVSLSILAFSWLVFKVSRFVSSFAEYFTPTVSFSLVFSPFFLFIIHSTSPFLLFTSTVISFLLFVTHFLLLAPFYSAILAWFSLFLLNFSPCYSLLLFLTPFYSAILALCLLTKSWAALSLVLTSRVLRTGWSATTSWWESK